MASPKQVPDKPQTFDVGSAPAHQVAGASHLNQVNTAQAPQQQRAVGADGTVVAVPEGAFWNAGRALWLRHGPNGDIVLDPQPAPPNPLANTAVEQEATAQPVPAQGVPVAPPMRR